MGELFGITDLIPQLIQYYFRKYDPAFTNKDQTINPL